MMMMIDYVVDELSGGGGEREMLSLTKGARNEKVWDNFESLKNHCCHYVQKQMFFIYVFLFWGGGGEFSKENGPIMA